MMLQNVFTLLSSQHKTLRSDGTSSFLPVPQREDEFCRHEGDRQHYFEEGEERGMQRLDNLNIQTVFGKNWIHD